MFVWYASNNMQTAQTAQTEVWLLVGQLRAKLLMYLHHKMFGLAVDDAASTLQNASTSSGTPRMITRKARSNTGVRSLNAHTMTKNKTPHDLA